VEYEISLRFGPSVMLVALVQRRSKQNCRSFEVKLPSACSFIVDGLASCFRCSHYMFQPTWPSSGVYDILLFIPEGICFAAFVAFVACSYTMQFLICVCLLCFR
jgi:hypothetical protein